MRTTECTEFVRAHCRCASRDSVALSGPPFFLRIKRIYASHTIPRISNTGRGTNMSAAAGFVVPAGGGRHFDSPTPGRCFA